MLVYFNTSPTLIKRVLPNFWMQSKLKWALLSQWYIIQLVGNTSSIETDTFWLNIFNFRVVVSTLYTHKKVLAIVAILGNGTINVLFNTFYITVSLIQLCLIKDWILGRTANISLDFLQHCTREKVESLVVSKLFKWVVSASVVETLHADLHSQIMASIALLTNRWCDFKLH